MPSTRTYFTNQAAAAKAMGSLYAAGKISTWNGRQTPKGFAVRYLTPCRKAWFDLIQSDMDRFFGVAARAA